MKDTICEKLMWKILISPCLKCVGNELKEINVNELRKNSKKKYDEIIKRTPDIGSFMKNPLRVSLSGGAVWLAIYEASEGKITDKVFEEMVKESMSTPLMKKVMG